jgi:hypothetical protein
MIQTKELARKYNTNPDFSESAGWLCRTTDSGFIFGTLLNCKPLGSSLMSRLGGA